LLETIKVRKVKYCVDREKNKAIVEGVNMVSKHTNQVQKKPSRWYCKKEAAISNI
jgi:large subunit ribosomal protein L24